MNEILTKQAWKEIRFFINHWRQNPRRDEYGFAFDMLSPDPDFNGVCHVRGEDL